MLRINANNEINISRINDNGTTTESVEGFKDDNIPHSLMKFNIDKYIDIFGKEVRIEEFDKYKYQDQKQIQITIL